MRAASGMPAAGEDWVLASISFAPGGPADHRPGQRLYTFFRNLRLARSSRPGIGSRRPPGAPSAGPAIADKAEGKQARKKRTADPRRRCGRAGQGCGGRADGHEVLIQERPHRGKGSVRRRTSRPPELRPARRGLSWLRPPCGRAPSSAATSHSPRSRARRPPARNRPCRASSPSPPCSPWPRPAARSRWPPGTPA